MGGKEMKETTKTIVEWQNETFGVPKFSEITKKLGNEIKEFLQSGATEEAADVVIMLCAYVNRTDGVDLWEEVEKKMAINRAKTWKKQKDWTWQHE
jgi:predicted house-cleaning noncanonical NTP pyrophosphatase (MazG superfamily)